MQFISRIPSALAIRPGEGRLVNLLLCHSFFVGVNRVFLLSVSTSLFLTEYGANTLPYIYIATALANASVGFLYAWLGKRVSFVKLLVVNLAFQFILVAGFWLLLGSTTAQWPIIAFMIALELLWLLTSLEFWSLSARIFNIQQGKRLFGVISAGETIASIIGGFSIPLIVSSIGTHNLLIPALLSILASLVLILLINRLYADRLANHHNAVEPGSVEQRTVSPLKNRYILLIFIFSCIATISYYFLDNAFYGLTEIHFPGNDGLTSFLGVYFAIVALAQLAFQTFLNARIINRVGITTAIILVPVIGTLMLGATAAVSLFAGTATLTFLFIAAARLVEYVIRDTITTASQMTLYQSLPPTTRLQTEAQVESFIEPVTTGLTGILLLFVLDGLKWNVIHLIYLSMFIGLVWIASATLLSREYPKALLQALSKRRLGNARVPDDDFSVAALLKTPLEERDADDVLYLLTLADANTLPQLLPRLLDHPAPEVRQDALTRIEKLHLTSACRFVRQRLTIESDLTVRAAAIQTAAAIDREFAAEQAVVYLDSDKLPLQIAAISGLMRSGLAGEIALADNRLQKLLDSPNPEERIAAVHAIGDSHITHHVPSVLRLLEDRNMKVCRAACHAAGKLRDPLLWPTLLNNLSVGTVQSAALAALSSGDATLQPYLTAQFHAVREGYETGKLRRRNLASQLIRIANRLGDTALLASQIDFPEPAIRGQVLAALVSLKSHIRDAEIVKARIQAEIQTDLLYLQGLALVKDDTELYDSLYYLLDRLRERVFALCTLIYDAAAMARIHIDYHSESEARQSYALEMLHVTLTHDIRSLVIALLDHHISEHRGLNTLLAFFGETALTRDQWLEQVLTSDDSPSWLKVMTLSGILARGENEAREAVLSAVQDSNAVVRETAHWALRHPLVQVPFEGNMLPTIEKILLLKSANLFSHVPDPILFEIASIVKDEVVPEGKTIIHKGDLGDFMYIIAYGRVRIHDGDQTITYLGEKDEFGELALLDSEPRNASATAVEETHLLRLDQNTFYELTSGYPEVLRGIIQVLLWRLRETTRRATLPREIPALVEA
ncbi:MAG: HEAT repeat domain-containing protein [Chloroflexi bacterium]|nr:HEAT repeat domain-containing protein [Chloroflexota bacterium]MCC6892970.1 HEAT repeat domain-containing protein [Anaerolineae bacterium]